MVEKELIGEDGEILGKESERGSSGARGGAQYQTWGSARSSLTGRKTQGSRSVPEPQLACL